MRHDPGTRHPIGRAIAALAVAATLALPATLVEAAQASRTRPGGKTSASPSGTRTRPVGKATYGHYRGHGHRGHYGYYGHHHYGYYPSYYWGWAAWPYWGWWYPGPHYAYSPRPRVVATNSPGSIETDVKPGRAEIRVDGVYVGEARDFNGRWDLLWLEPGGHEVEFSRDGYQTLKQWVDVPAGGYVRIDQRLAKGDGIDARSTEAPPEPPPTARAEARETREAREPDFRSQMALRRGLVRFDVRPADAAVYLDGEFLAEAGELARLHGAIPVAEGIHTIEIVRPGFVGKKLDVEVSGQTPVRVEVELERR